MNKLSLNAHAKINLFLEVTGKREDGYHNIESVMMQIPLCDTVELEKTEKCSAVELSSLWDGCVRISDFDTLDPKDNLCFKAASLFFERLGERESLTNGIKITVIKKIPVKSGMAGGSADAAAVFSGMNRLFGEPFSTEELCRMGALLGADIPFCIKGKTVLCKGIGDIMEDIPVGCQLHGLVSLEGDTKLSTGAAYSLVDKNCKRALYSSHNIVNALKNGDISSVAKECYNIFGLSCGYSRKAEEILLENGALNATLSGAGPSVFGLFDSKEAIEKAKYALTLQGYPAFEF